MSVLLTRWKAESATPAGWIGRRLAFYHANQTSFWDRLSWVLMGTAAALVLFTFRDYGVTWDEDVHNWYGNLVLDYYVSLFADRAALHWRDLYNYGALFDAVAAALNWISPLGIYETRHLLGGLVGILGVIGCWKAARAMMGSRAGFIAALFLILTPNYYGQMFNNPKDIPFAVAGIWAIYYMILIIPTLPQPPLRLAAKLGATIGLAMGVRIGGLLLLCYLGLLLALDGIWRAAVARRLLVLFDTAWSSWRYVFLPVVLVAYPLTLVFWPWAQADPVDNPLRALAFFSHQTFPFDTLFAGRFIPATDLPWAYLPTYIVIALPELVLVLLLCAPVAAVIAVAKGRFDLRRQHALAAFVLGIGILFPVAYAIAIRAVLFDGMRHFIFVLPLIAVTAAVVADGALDRLARFRYRRPIYALMALYGGAHVTTMVLLHPDQYLYYNAFVGGVPGAQRQFKLDYWANSYAEAVNGLKDYLRAEDGANFEDHEFTVAVCGPPISATYFFPVNFRFTRRQNEADFFISFTKDNCDRSLPGRPVYRVERMGTLISVVLDRRNFVASSRNANHAAAGNSQSSAAGSAVP